MKPSTEDVLMAMMDFAGLRQRVLRKERRFTDEGDMEREDQGG
jgi:hypothetical protein